MGFDSKNALVTGATSGIGRAIALKLAASGMHVVGCGRRSDRLEALRLEIEATGGRFLPIVCDLRDPESIADMFTGLRASLGGVDILVNSAGLGFHSPLLSGETETWREMLDVNVLALCICTREAVADMRRRGDNGYVIHISSMSGHRVPGGSGVYSATKFAVRSLTEGLRMELHDSGSGIRVSAVSPGFVETEFAEVYHQSQKKAQETYSRYRVLDAEDVAEQVFFLLGTPPHVQVHDVLMRPHSQPG
jgi:17beta-estradiol 17-dehydrogenase / 3beta-hydroxysteroid 3-dehydrogenase